MTRDEIEAMIRDAFAGVQLGDGMSIGEAEGADEAYRSDKWKYAHDLRAFEITDDWSAVPWSELDRDNFAHMGGAELRYYLPALMLRLLDDYDPIGMWCIGAVGALGEPRRFLESLSAAQRQAIAVFVKTLPELVSLHREDQAVLALAYREVWAKELPESP